ncbi:LamB/YcsF family protein [Microbacterium sp. gxy059]|uniref:LamB/YcsF family protein n=1 Tax=Microbacterium sp. gxy059 TaxID=2957199 RepID=UPI003D97D12E
MATIDLNSDLGESFGPWPMGADEAMLAHVSSANIACGFHAGDPSGIAATCRSALAAGAAIGAHVGYRDLAGFGRRFLDCAPAELADDIVYQIGALAALARAAGGAVRYVKPHGALYGAIVRHEGHARAVVDAIRAVDPGLALLALPGSLALDLAERAGIRPVAEAFADRAYMPDGTLAPRREPGAVLHDVDEVARRMARFGDEGVIDAIDGTPLRIRAESVCLHGDTPGAVAMAGAVRGALVERGVRIEAFA